MSAPADLAYPAIRWDLTALFSGMEDPKIEQTWKLCTKRAKKFEADFRGKIESANLSAQTLAAALSEIEDIAKEAGKPANYANLLFSVDASSPEVGAFMQKQMEHGSELSVLLMFFELELQSTPQETIDRIASDPALANYTHYIHHARAYSPYRLGEKEEIVLEQVANTG